MKLGWQTRTIRILAVPLLAAAMFACGKLDPRSQMTANQPPRIALDRPSVASTDDSRQLGVSWRASDPDGRIDHFVYASNPASVDRVDAGWIRTNETKAVLRFPRSAAIGRASAGARDTERPQVFSVRAVDNLGAMSAPATVALVGDNLAPMIYITNPAPNAVFSPVVPTSLDIHWAGQDVDGRIVKYKYRLFSTINPDFPGIPDFISVVMGNPDTLRALYAPGFAGWDSVGGNVTSVTYSNLGPNQDYLFAITAFDDAGDYDPVFSTNTNVLKFFVTDRSDIGPLTCVASSIFNYCTSTGGEHDVAYEIPSGLALPVSWVSFPQSGGQGIAGYRWVLDPLDPTDMKDRDHSNADPHHWSAWSLDATSTTVGPFAAGDASEHVLSIQAKDNVGLMSTLRVHFTVVQSSFAHDLLIVDDTRLTPDQIQVGIIPPTVAPPSGPWPTAAELDTFLYARGGFPWQGYPAGTLSPPGLLNGYDFDTLGTRGLPGAIVPLSVLSRYRQVMWLIDNTSATYIGPPSSLLEPITSLRLMSSPGQMNTLSAYVSQGGKLWLSGGGAAYATLVSWGKRNTPPDDWTNIDGELIPGRFMYDFAHWQSAVAVRPGRQALINTPDFAPWPNATMGRGWSGQGMDHTLAQPNYAKLSADPVMNVLQPKTCTSDPPPPLRFCNSFYLLPSYPAEYIGRNPAFGPIPNFIQEDTDPRPNHEHLESTLDTLYTVAGGSVPGVLPVMTYYHGFESGPVVFSGFPIWFFQKQQGTKLVDFVLQDIWGLAKGGGAAISTTAPLVRQRGSVSAATLSRQKGGVPVAAPVARHR